MKSQSHVSVSSTQRSRSTTHVWHWKLSSCFVSQIANVSKFLSNATTIWTRLKNYSNLLESVSFTLLIQVSFWKCILIEFQQCQAFSWLMSCQNLPVPIIFGSSAHHIYLYSSEQVLMDKSDMYHNVCYIWRWTAPHNAMYFLPRSLTQKLVKPLVVGDLGLKLDRSSRAPFVPQCTIYHALRPCNAHYQLQFIMHCKSKTGQTSDGGSWRSKAGPF